MHFFQIQPWNDSEVPLSTTEQELMIEKNSTTEAVIVKSNGKVEDEQIA